jgi:hypothetical protein
MLICIIIIIIIIHVGVVVVMVAVIVVICLLHLDFAYTFLASNLAKCNMSVGRRGILGHTLSCKSQDI